jgi:hypothetical protein
MYLSMCVRRCDDHALVNVESEVDINSAPLLQQRLTHLLEGNELRVLAELTGLAGELPVAGSFAAERPTLGA